MVNFLRLIAPSFDVFITSDKNLRHQQNLASLDLAVILLPTNQVPAVKALLDQLDTVLDTIGPNEFIKI